MAQQNKAVLKRNKSLLLLGLPIAALAQISLYNNASCYASGSTVTWTEVATFIALSLAGYYVTSKYLSGKRRQLLAVMTLVIIVSIIIALFITLFTDWNKAGFHCLTF